MKKAHDLTGQRFGRLVVIKRVENNKRQEVQWLCQCDCGNTKVVCAAHLKKGNTFSCGCLKRERSVQQLKTHGLSYTRIYGVWAGIKYRCYNANQKQYKNYGGRGITMCDEWKNDFKVFYDWAIAHGYDEKASKGECTIDRIDVNGNYEPSNCRWVNNTTQQNNRRNNCYLTYNGETHTTAEWGKILNISVMALNHRIERGWTIERALTTPVRRINK